MDYENVKLKRSLETLGEALRYLDKSVSGERRILFLSVAKAFETALEYSWRELQRRIEDEGLDAPSPQATIREAARLGLIDSAEKWIEFVNARNAGVHDYFGTTDEEYISIAREFLMNSKKAFDNSNAD